MTDAKDHDWTVWGLGREPLHTGTEEETKDYVVARTGVASDLYIMSPDGDEFVYDETMETWRKE